MLCILASNRARGPGGQGIEVRSLRSAHSQGGRGFLVVHTRGRGFLCCRGLRGLLVHAHAQLHGEPQGIGARPALKRP